MNKDNILWKLDLLEAKHLHAKPRLPKTKTLLNAKHKKKLPLLDLNRTDAIAKIGEFKSQLCERKVYSSLLKLNRLLKKVIALEKNKLKLKMDDGKLKSELDVLNGLDVECISHAKLIKLMLKVYKINVKNADSIPGFLPSWCIETITNVEDKFNPKFQFKSNSQLENNTISKLFNHKDFKPLVEEVESSLKIILGPVERKRKEKSDDSDGDGESDDDDSESDDEEEKSVDELIDEEDIDLDAYKGMLVGSDEEEEDGFKLDPNIDYTQITDEEPSDDDEDDSDSEEEEGEDEDIYAKLKLEKRKLANDDFFDFEAAEKSEKSKKVKLPALQGGYFSGGESDSDVDNDKVVKAATSQRKNRRGQRARQKIWEMKYGSGAKHVEKEKIRVRSEREQKQKEYEERVRKREEKLRLLLEQGGTGSNQTPLSRERTHKPGSHPPAPVQAELEKPLHPSWEAKLRAQELSKQKFSGKKIVFE